MLTSIGLFLQEAGSGDQCLPHASQSVHFRTLCSLGWQCVQTKTQVSTADSWPIGQCSDFSQYLGECAAACVAWLHTAAQSKYCVNNAQAHAMFSVCRLALDFYSCSDDGVFEPDVLAARHERENESLQVQIPN